MRKLWALALVLAMGCCSKIEAFADTPQGPLTHIKFAAEVTDSNVDTFQTALTTALATKPPFLLLELNSPGGNVDAGFKMAKAIEESPVPITCVVDGEADSMMFYILQSCPSRYMTNRSLLMMHQAYNIHGAGGRYFSDDYDGMSKQLVALNAAMLEHMARRMKWPKAKIKARIAHRQQWWMGAEEALQVGAVDGTALTVKDVLDALNKKLDKK